jgi:hypothetical protein
MKLDIPLAYGKFSTTNITVYPPREILYIGFLISD